MIFANAISLKGRNSQSGYLLLPVAIAIALIGVIAFLISSESAIEVNMTKGELETARAQYVAQAGLQHALREHAQQGCGPYTDLTKVAFGVDEYDTRLTHDLGGTAAYTVTVEQDTWIRDDFPTNNYASDTKMHIRSEGGVTERPLLRYDLSTVPAKSAVLSARAWFYVNMEHSEGPVDIHQITTDWTDTDATWNSMGTNIGGTVIASIPTEPGSGVWVSVNLTAQVQAWINGEPNNGITINTNSAGVHSEYLTSESAFPPYIEVLVGAPPTSPARLRSTSKIDGGGAASVKRDLGLVQSPAGYSHLQPDDTDGKDAWVSGDKATWNYGGADFLRVRAGGGGHWRSLLEFELEALPRGAHIVSAEMEIYRRYNNQEAPGTIEVYPVTQSWIEGGSSGGASPGVTFDYRDTALPWSSSGGDYASTLMTSFDVTAATDTWYSVDVKSLVRYWAAGNANHGLILVAGDNNVLAEFIPSEHVDRALRPKLSVTYSCECGTVCVAPQGSGKIALIGDDNSPDPDDQVKIAIIESWGYDVNFYQDRDSNTINWNNYDLVYISETSRSVDLDSGIKDAPIGVINEEPNFYKDMELADGFQEHVGSSLDIVDNSHYITAPFALGALSIYTADMEILTVNNPAPDLQRLADFGGNGSLTVLELGAQTTGGNNVPGRRVTLPLGQHFAAGFDWSKLNSNGYLLVQRAIEWGMGKDKVSIGNVLLVVVNPGSMSAQESSKKTLIEGWGYTVNLIDDGDSQANFDTAAAANDVIYVSGSISGGALADKLTGSPTPIVNEFAGKLDNFGFGSGTGNTVTASGFTATNAGHYISQPFAGSAVNHFTGNLVMPVASGTLAPGLISAASLGTLTWALPTLDAGAQRWDGAPAPARRVHLPFGAATASQLTDDGKTLMLRAIEWGAGAENPDFSTELLFVVADPSALTAAESAKKSLIESWGFTVNLIDDADSVANFAAAFGVNGVVYVSGEVNDSAIGSKLVKTSLGIVNEQIALHDELLLSTSAGTNSFSNIMVIDNTHYITQGINTGWHTIASSNQPLNALEGTLAPGMNNLAEVWISGANYDFGLAVVDTGGQLNAGEIAAGRRVQLPWGTAGFDFSALNANGENLMRRAIEWAGGAEIDLSPLAHWKLDEATGPTAVDSEGGHDGTWTNGPLAAPGLIDGGLQFDGGNDTVAVGSDESLDDLFVAGATISAWIYADGWGGGNFGRIADKADALGTNRNGWAFELYGANRAILFQYGFSGDIGNWYTPVDSIALGQWHHVVVTYDNGSASNDPIIYIDGVSQTLVELDTPSGTASSDAASDLHLGNYAVSLSRAFDGTLDDIRIYDRILSATEVADLYNADAPSPASYTELFQPWSATSDDTWQTVGLASFGVPANAVVEVAVTNSKDKNERWGGVRAVGSSLERRLQLHESEGGGLDVVTMHVQTDASSQIQHYADKKDEVKFTLLGYWTGASYVELFEPFTANSSNTWVDEDVSDDGLGANQVAEIAMVNTNQGVGRLAGLRSSGAAYQRRFDLHEAESGGVEALTLMVVTSGTAEVEAFAESAGDIDFYVLGFWSTPPGTYTEAGGVHGQALSASTWELTDLTGLGVPANTVAQFIVANEVVNFERSLGVREVGSGQNRVIELQEAEPDGSDLASMHVNVDSASNIEWYSGSGTTDRYFYPVGWWVLSP